jgi:hypothetical protein
MRLVLPAEGLPEEREDANRKITQAIPNRIVRSLRLEVCAPKPMSGASPAGVCAIARSEGVGRVPQVRPSVPPDLLYAALDTTAYAALRKAA